MYDDNPGDDVITPSHMMIGRRLLSVVRDGVNPENVDFSVENISKRCKHMNYLLQNFWARWRREYLTELREYHSLKNKVPLRQISLGEVVLIGDDKLPRNRWRMGVVTELYSGKDGLVRGCKLRTLSKQGGISYISRPIVKLYPLEIKSYTFSKSGNQLDAVDTNCTENVDAENSANQHCSNFTGEICEINRKHEKSNRPIRSAAIKGICKRISGNQA